MVRVLVVAGGALLVAASACARRAPAAGPSTRAASRPGARPRPIPPLPEPRAHTVSASGAFDEGGRVVRVALATEAVAPRIGGTGEWRLFAGNAVVARGGTDGMWTVERRGRELRATGPGGVTGWYAGPLVLRPAAPTTLLVHGGRRWRGELWLWPAGASGVTVVDAVGIEDYLRGVVPLELSSTQPADVHALAAQAVAARSYTHARLAEGRAAARADRPFDLRATVADQVYGGVDAERPLSDRAIRATTGLVLRHRGAVVTAPYHSTCGGQTAAPADVWRMEAEPWMRSVSDRIPGTDRHWCDGSPRFRWVREYDARALGTVIERYLRRYAIGAAAAGADAGDASASNTGANAVPVGGVRALGIVDRSASGRVARLAVTTEQGRFVVRGNDIRYVVRTLGGEILPSTYFAVDATVGGDGRLARVTLRGHGNGHGVGMCQWGAMGRARAGLDFRAILQAYYPGTAIEPAE